MTAPSMASIGCGADTSWPVRLTAINGGSATNVVTDTGAPPHHHPAFDIDESAIGLLSELFVRSAIAHLAPADRGRSERRAS